MFKKPAILAIALAFCASLFAVNPVSAETTLRVVMHSDLKIVDPVWTTAYMSRNYGYMVYDTLFALDSKLHIQPQMVEDYSVSDDKLTYTMTLRDGLMFHDGAPVTAADAVASLKRWGKKDGMGQMLMEYTANLSAVNDKTMKLVLKKPFGLVLDALSKPSSNVPFIMPKRVADTPADEQIKDHTGSGPFIFKEDEWKPGDRTVFVKNPHYKARSEPSSWMAGSKAVNVDRVEWISIKDHQTAVSALLAGEIDYMESVPHDLLPLLESDPNVQTAVLNPLGNQYMYRMNHLHPPFDDVRMRRAAMWAVNQKDFLQGVIGNPKYYKECAAMFFCDTPLATDKGAEIMMRSDYAKSKALLKEAGYDGTPIVLMHSTDLNVLANLAPVAKQNLERGGFKVDMQSMDWQTLVSRRSKKDAPGKVGWNIFMTSWQSLDILNPIMAAGYRANCNKAWFGWPCDIPNMEVLRKAFAEEPDPAQQKAIAEAIQVRAMEFGTHGHAGQWLGVTAWRKDLISNVPDAPLPVQWGISK